MSKKIYVVRHCKAVGQEYGAELTIDGQRQAQELVKFFANISIEKIISSPYKRAVDSIYPLANARNIEIEIDERLSERILSIKNLPDWQEKLNQSFMDLDIIFDGGESSRQAMNRGLEVVDQLMQGKEKEILIVTHGNLMALLLKYYQPSFGYTEWEQLSNPDVYLIVRDQETAAIKRIWE